MSDEIIQITPLIQMPIKAIDTHQTPKVIGPYSKAIVAVNTVYISGQLGVDKAGNFVSDNVGDQAGQAIDNLGHIIKVAGGSLSNIVKTTVLLHSMEDFKEVNDVYASTRACYQVARLPRDAKVEIEAIAYLD